MSGFIHNDDDLIHMGYRPVVEKCVACSGSGNDGLQDWDDPRAFRKRMCRKCNGRGFVETYEAITLDEVLSR